MTTQNERPLLFLSNSLLKNTSITVDKYVIGQKTQSFHILIGISRKWNMSLYNYTKGFEKNAIHTLCCYPKQHQGWFYNALSFNFSFDHNDLNLCTHTINQGCLSLSCEHHPCVPCSARMCGISFWLDDDSNWNSLMSPDIIPKYCPQPVPKM